MFLRLSSAASSPRGRWPHLPWGRAGAGIAAALSLPLTLAAACGQGERTPKGSAARPPLTVDGGTTACTGAETRECTHVVGEHNGITTCVKGTQKCIDGHWGPCEGTMQATSVPRWPAEQTASEQGARASHDGAERTPLSLSDAGVCLNDPCDPGCMVYDEAPDGGITPTIVVDGGQIPQEYLDKLLNDVLHGPDYTECSSTGFCMMDHRCDQSVCGGPLNKCGTCIEYKDGELNPNCSSKPDYTIKQASPISVPVCNRGPDPAPAGAKIGVFSGSKADILDAIGKCTGLVQKKQGCCPGAASDGSAKCTHAGPLSTTLYPGCYIPDPLGLCCEKGYKLFDTHPVTGKYILHGPLKLEAICYSDGPIPAGKCLEAPDCYKYLGKFPLLLHINTTDLKDYDGIDIVPECECGNNQTMPLDTGQCGVLLGGAIAVVTPGGFENKLLDDVDHPPDYSPCQPGTCQADHRCDTKTGKCIAWQPEEFDPSCLKPNFTVGVPCKGYLPVCNRGSVAAPAGVKLAFISGNSSQLQNNLGKCDKLEGKLEKSCTLSAALAPGECINAMGDCGPLPDGTKEIAVNSDGIKTGLLDECICGDNWSAYNSTKIGACLSTSPSLDWGQSYTGQCGEKQQVEWRFLGFDVTNWPASYIVIKAHAAEPPEALSPVPPCADCVELAQAGITHPDQCLLSGPTPPCPVSLYDGLGELNRNKSVLELLFEFHPDPDNCKLPVLNNWQLTYTCIDYE